MMSNYLDDKNKKYSDFSNDARDNTLKLQLDNYVAATIERTNVEDSEDQTSIQIVLYNRKGIEISRTRPITIDAVGNKVVKKLELIESEGVTNGKLRITFKGKDPTDPTDTGYIDCPLDEIYNKIKANSAAILLKQDKLIDDVTKQGTEVSNIKTINDQSLLGSGNIEIISGVQSVNGQTGDVVLKTSDLENDCNYIDKTYHDKSKQDTLISGQNIKTINSKSLLGSGNIEIQGGGSSKYDELESVALSSIIEGGIYKVTNAPDNPTSTAKNGLLEAKELTDSRVFQEWMSETNRAVRVMNIVPSLQFYVNGVLQQQGDIHLASGGTYELEGDLRGSIIIGTGAEEANNRTKIILKGVNIQTTTQYAAINYTDAASKLVVEIASTTENYLMVDKDEPKSDEDLGCLHSENNLVIQGVGYLTIKNKKGHGIRGSELVINGDPHIYIDSKHDAVHGGKMLKITGGHFKVVNANDAFSSSAGATNAGQMQIFGGEFIIDKCAEAAFDGKSTNGLKQILGGTKITLGQNVAQAFTSPNGFKLYTGQVTIINEYGKSIPEYTDLASMFGVPTILDPELNPIDCTQDTIVINNNTHKAAYTMSGNFSGKKIIIKQGSGAGTDLNISKLYYKNTDTTNLDAFISVEHVAGVEESNKKCVKLKLATEDSINYIYKEAGYAIKADKNIQVTSKGNLFITCNSGTALHAPNGYVLLAGDGIRKVVNSSVGIYANSVKLGEDPDDAAEYKPGDASNSDDAIYVMDNTSCDIKISKQGDPVYTSQIIATPYHAGMSLIDSIIQDAGTNGKIIAQKGTVHQKTGTDYINTALLYAGSSALQINEYVVEYEAIEGFKETIPELDPSEEATWKVYATPDNVYTKEEVDAKLAVISAEAAKQQQTLYRLQKFEDHFASTIYGDCPKLVWTKTEEVSELYIVRGERGSKLYPVWTENSTTYAYNKDGSGYEDAGANAQFNIVVKCPVDKVPSWDISASAGAYETISYKQYCEGSELVANYWLITITKVNANITLNIKAEAGGSLNPSIDENGDLKMSGVAVDDLGDVNLGNKAVYTDETNDVKLN